MNEINGITSFKIHPNIVFTLIDDEAVVMEMEKESLFGMNAVATQILKCIESQAMSLDAISDHLTQQFAVDEMQCKAEAKAFLELLLAKNLVITVD